LDWSGVGSDVWEMKCRDRGGREGSFGERRGVLVDGVVCENVKKAE